MQSHEVFHAEGTRNATHSGYLECHLEQYFYRDDIHEIWTQTTRNHWKYPKTKFLHMLVKLVLISDTYCIFIVCYTPIATFQKAGTCLDAQQSMAKQPIKG